VLHCLISVSIVAKHRRKGVNQMKINKNWIVCSIVLGCFIAPAFAGDFPICTEATADQNVPVVAYDGTNYLVVWGDYRLGADVYGQLVSPSGSLIGSEFVISTTGMVWNIAIAWDGTNYLVVWDVNAMEIYGQLVSPSGSLVDSNFVIATDSLVWAPKNFPAVAWDGTNFLVVWQDSKNDQVNYYYDIYGQLVSPTGTLVGGSSMVSTAAAYNQQYSAVAWDGTRFLVVWEDLRSGVESDIYGRRVSSSGAYYGPEIAISTAENNQSGPAIAFDGTNYFVVWSDTRDPSQDDIYGQFVSPQGTLVDTDVPICTADYPQYNPAIVWDGTNYFVVWQDCRDSYPYSDIYGQFVSPTGSLVYPENVISTSSSQQENPALAFDGTHYLVVWNDDRNGTVDIYGNIDTEMASEEVINFRVPERMELIVTPTISDRDFSIKYGFQTKVNLQNEQPVSLELYDSAGRLVRNLFKGNIGPGYSYTVWDGRDAVGSKVPLGIYFCKLTVDNLIKTAKVVVIE
jgi:hypothetical protein